MAIAFGKEFPDEFQDLIDCLANNQWEKANRITEDLERFETRLILDELWTEFSNGYFGFTIQSQIWQEVGGFVYPKNRGTQRYNDSWESGDSDSFMEARDRYLDRVGRGRNGCGSKAPPGYLPFGRGGSLESFIERFSHIVAAQSVQ
ncbi:GUN4 domain-containing protein [Leptolyngbya sp. FACHB-16]|uniref:GUN4 domain-containing protein n=1 Tax=unclassified Leptolyngbya TaxID=2650499 RepID=UPI0016886F5E|nr:GUN4 domain-containing protein [Leptolyngbya sp. FACHB-16]MBD2158885.1 GUN4 domain-containing protein [Leptolyngbya sp. FACHB-16]